MLESVPLKNIVVSFFFISLSGPGSTKSCSANWRPEAEFLDIIGTKVLRVFLLTIYSHLKIMPRNLNEIVRS
jgi:hypothetical protein